jgi:hypothetical protein
MKAGELRIARNYMYLPGTSYLTALRGRRTIATIGAPITGLVWIKFRSGTAYLVASAGSAYYSATADGASAFSSVSTLTASAGRMQGFYSDHTDRAYFIDGVNRMRVWTGSGAMRNAGLQTPSSGTVVWSATGSKYPQDSTFYYAHSEYDSTNDIESPLCNPVQSVSTADDGTFKYTFPTTTTNGSSFDQYRCYKTQHGGNVFYRVGTIAKATTVWADGTDTDVARVDNSDILGTGFTNIDDEFLSTKEYSPMVGQGLKTNAITSTGLPPVGAIGGFFQGVFWVSGVAGYPHHVYWSNEFQPETFSPVNFMPIGNDYGDPVTAGGVCNDRQIFFTTNSIYRLNAWPSVVDPGFGLGAVRREEVTKDHGCIAKRSVTNFGVGQPNNRLFYLSTRGPMVTDGYGTWPLHADLDWSNRIINPAYAKNAVAVNYPKYQQVWLFCPSKSSTTNDIAFIYHYDSSHIKHSETVAVGKWMGPAHVRCAAAALGLEENTEGVMYIADTDGTGRVYQEDDGGSDAQLYDDANGGIWAEWETGDWPLGAESTEKRARRVFLSIVGSEEYRPRLSFAKSKATKEDHVGLTLITESGSEEMTMGRSSSKQMKTRTYRGGIWRTGTHMRFHSNYIGTGEHSVATIEIEVEEMGEA